MMLGAKGILTPLIPDCYVLCTLAILKNIRNPLIFSLKNGYLLMFHSSHQSPRMCEALTHWSRKKRLGSSDIFPEDPAG